MALPKIKHPTYSFTIPSLKKAVNVRPFTVQEEKILLMAKSSNKSEDVLSAVKQIIQNCIIEPIEVDKLATFDIEYLFIKLRSKSIGEVVDLIYTDTESEEEIKFQVNLDDVEIKNNPDHSNKIMINDELGIVMKYPTLKDVKNVELEAEDSVIEVLINCIDKIFDNDTVYSEFTREELIEFIDNLPMESMNEIKKFFDTMPVLEHKAIVKNKQGIEKEVVLKGLNSFFMS